ncbi:MAG: DUF2279 domain-containing protein [Chitinophagaceae bacterium]|nr:DUF2279 domain-containing protein [Chitinophagaceae bacterium]
MGKGLQILILILPIFSSAQDSIPLLQSITTTERVNFAENTKREWIIGGITTAAFGGSLILLNETWYKNYDKTSFHVFNDSGEWLQMDKIGHSWTAYNISHATASTWQWTGMSKNRSIILGSVSSLGYLAAIEFLDAHSTKWGWSWADITANFFGTSLFALQEMKWNEQKFQLKFSAHMKNYESSLQKRADELFGNTLAERLLKDYNQQTYWLSLNVKSFITNAKLPQWLNISVGYGAQDMFGGFENVAYDKNGNLTFSRLDIKRYRQFYLSPDVDFTKIKTTNKVLKTTFNILNALKLPAPALEFSNGKLQGHILLF